MAIAVRALSPVAMIEGMPAFVKLLMDGSVSGLIEFSKMRSPKKVKSDSTCLLARSEAKRVLYPRARTQNP